MMTQDPLDKCPLDGSFPDDTCLYVGRAYREGYGKMCKQHDYRIQKYGDPYATPLPEDGIEPTWEVIMHCRRRGDLNRNA